MTLKTPLESIQRKLQGEVCQRSIDASVESVDDATRTVNIAWASEYADMRWFGQEILNCEPQSVRLGRLNDGGALLFNHNEQCLIGVVESAEVGSDRVCRAKVRFDTCEEAETRYQQVRNKVLKHVSVKYRVHKMVLESESDDDGAVYRVTDWEPYELSFVTIPFDPTVGVGRSFDDQTIIKPAEAVAAIAPERIPHLPISPETVPIQLKETRKMTPEIIEENKRQADAALASQKTSHELDLKRREDIVELGVRYADYLTLSDVQDACRSAKTVAQVQETVMEKMKGKHSDTRGVHVGLTAKETEQFSIAKAVRAICSGDWKEAGLERSASEAASTKFNTPTRGFLIPMDVFASRAFISGTAIEAGNLIQTSLRPDLFVDVLRNQLVLGKMGITMLYGLNGNIDMPRKTSGSTLGFVTEVAAVASTQPNTGKVTLAPKRIGGFIDFSKQAVIQSAMAVEPLLRQDILAQYLRDVENAVINGSGAGSNPRGIRNTAGIGSVAGGVNGLAPAWSHAVDLESACANVNSEPDAFSGYLLNTKTRGRYKQTQKAANLQFCWDNGDQPLNGYRAAVSNVMPSNLTKGTSTGVCSSMLFGSDWSSSVLGTFGAVEILLDELTQSVNGMNRLVMNAFIDHGVRRAADFASIDDLLAG